ncbi:MAG: hypothetical protein GF398_21370 [Chitinivibrionales bacterium]|nr:hypothetical protein [Chitinivibrionales bacterium]
MKNNHCLRVGALVLVLGAFLPAASFQRFKNFAPPISVNDILFSGNMVWAATSGGLFKLDPVKQTGTLESNPSKLPDLEITALAEDEKGNIWIGSRRGYLIKKQPNDAYVINSSYFAFQWEITHILPYGNNLIIASDKGCSIFDPDKMVALKNAEKIGSFKSATVYTSAVLHDTLYLGCKEGMAWLDIGDNRLETANFYDQQIWTTRSAPEPIKTLLVRNNAVNGFNRPADYFKNELTYADSTEVSYGRTRSLNLPGIVTFVKSDGKGTCWIGTQTDYFFAWDGEENPIQYKIKGMTFANASNISLSSRGEVWLSSNVSSPPFWYQGVLQYDGDSEWTLHNSSAEGMGKLGGGAVVGLLADIYGDVWVGTTETNVKRYNRESDRWYRYFVSGRSGYSGFRRFKDDEDNSWGKADAFCNDSSGYLWIGSWEHYSGCLICVKGDALDPGDGDYRRYYPQSSPHFVLNVNALGASPDGAIVAGGAGGEILIARHDGTPLDGGVETENFYRDFITVPDVTFTRSNAYFATGKGLAVYSFEQKQLSIDSSVTTGITSVEAESNNVIWIGTNNDGLIRYDVAKNEQDSKTTVDETAGLISNQINDMALDKVNGHLWIAATEGVSRYDLAQTGASIGTHEKVRVYPNPFSFSNPNHREVFFKRLPANTSLAVYDLGGALVAEVEPSIKADREWTFGWSPDRRIMPGTYFYVAQSETDNSAGKIIINP